MGDALAGVEPGLSIFLKTPNIADPAIGIGIKCASKEEVNYGSLSHNSGRI